MMRNWLLKNLELLEPPIYEGWRAWLLCLHHDKSLVAQDLGPHINNKGEIMLSCFSQHPSGPILIVQFYDEPPVAQEAWVTYEGWNKDGMHDYSVSIMISHLWLKILGHLSITRGESCLHGENCQLKNLEPPMKDGMHDYSVSFMISYWWLKILGHLSITRGKSCFHVSCFYQQPSGLILMELWD